MGRGGTREGGPTQVELEDSPGNDCSWRALSRLDGRAPLDERYNAKWLVSDLFGGAWRGAAHEKVAKRRGAEGARLPRVERREGDEACGEATEAP